MDKVLIFNGSGYEVRSGEMKTLFRACGVWDLVDKGYKEKGRTKKGLEIDTRVDNTVLLVIKQKVTGPAALCIASAEKSKEAWNILERKYKVDLVPLPEGEERSYFRLIPRENMVVENGWGPWVTARDGHQPTTPGGLPLESDNLQYSHLSIAYTVQCIL
nr:Protein accelerated cell death 6 [Ipomoea batatas]